ncbi:MAG TPA: right-handed parallel beta-helix repeat-containing protein [Pyrinomonadaceae bacterium]|nr:right-handed parallel beta-helix repeat-containing protein [Pyrinomonadaceae bacterium]
MNNLPRQKLVEIVRRHGREIISEPRRCEGLMRDHFPAHRREIAVLAAALDERIPTELLAPGKSLIPRGAMLARLAARLHDDVAMEMSAARWTVHTWALALGVITADELNALEQAEGQAGKEGERTAEHQVIEPLRVNPTQAARTQAPSPTHDLHPVSSSPRTSFIVALDGSGDFLTITDAIRRSSAGSRLVVRPGIYNEGLLIDRALEIIGDGAAGEIVVRATSSSCLFMHTDEATIRNLTLRGQARSGGAGGDGFFAVDIPRGRLLLDRCDISSDSLACIAIHNPTAAPLIRGCRIHHGVDSGVFAFDGAKGMIEECDIFENANIGIAIAGGASTGVRGCHVHHGLEAGIVIWNQASSIVEDSDIYTNRRTNVGVSDGGIATLRNCRIHDGDNTGVFAHRGGRVAIEACNIYRHAEPEVAITSSGDVRLGNCKIHNSQSHGVFISDRGRVLLENCDVFGNRAAGLRVEEDGTAIARTCNINDNGHVGVSCASGGAVEVEGCDLTENRVAAWETNYGAQVVSRRNRH